MVAGSWGEVEMAEAVDSDSAKELEMTLEDFVMAMGEFWVEVPYVSPRSSLMVVCTRMRSICISIRERQRANCSAGKVQSARCLVAIRV